MDLKSFQLRLCCKVTFEKSTYYVNRYFIKSFFFKKWAIPGLFFLYCCLFNTQLTVNKCSI